MEGEEAENLDPGATAAPSASSAGEENAQRGYGWQYDHLAGLTYDRLGEDRLVQLRLVDPKAGRVDDCVLVLTDALHGFQFKNPINATFKFSDLASDQWVSGNKREPLIVDLLKGLRQLRSMAADFGLPADAVRVHFVTSARASAHDRMPKTSGESRTPHFSEFLRDVLDPIRTGALEITDVDARWEAALARLEEACGVNRLELGDLLRHLEIQTDVVSIVEPTRIRELSPNKQRWTDIVHLSKELQRSVQVRYDNENVLPGTAPILLTPQNIVELAGWQTRAQTLHVHLFPVDIDTYEPLATAIDELRKSIEAFTSGYIALLGPPGSGKSTMLGQSLPHDRARVVRYLAFVPGDGTSRYARTTQHDFLHDLAVSLYNSGLKPDGALPSSDPASLPAYLDKQLQLASQEYMSVGRRTIVVIDGLDHVERENPSSSTLLQVLPATDTPEGVLIVIGSQTRAPLNARVREQLVSEPTRVVDITNERLSPQAIQRICNRLPRMVPLSQQDVARIIDLTAGHPLALSYLLNAIGASDAETTSAILRNTPKYSGNIAEQYAVYWDEIASDDEIVELLGIVARLQPPIDLDWLEDFAPSSAYRQMRLRLRHLFRGLSSDKWRFFHDSFRQFVLDRTSRNWDSELDDEIDRQFHARIAELARQGSRPSARWRELYHAYYAGDEARVLKLGTHQQFRSQLLEGRRPSAVSHDARLCLQLAARHSDVVSLVSCWLALAEVYTREFNLKSRNVPRLMLDVGLTDEAIDFLAVDDYVSNQATLADSLEAALYLDELGRPEGRLLFDMLEPQEFTEHRSDGSRGDIAEFWACGAVRFRPIELVARTIVGLFDEAAEARQRRSPDRTKYRDDDETVPFHLALRMIREASEELLRANRDSEADQLIELLNAEQPRRAQWVSSSSDAEEQTIPERDIDATFNRLLSSHLASAQIRRAQRLENRGAADEAAESLIDFAMADPPWRVSMAQLVVLAETAIRLLTTHFDDSAPVRSKLDDIVRRASRRLRTEPNVLAADFQIVSNRTSMNETLRRRTIALFGSIANATDSETPEYESLREQARSFQNADQQQTSSLKSVLTSRIDGSLSDLVALRVAHLIKAEPTVQDSRQVVEELTRCFTLVGQLSRRRSLTLNWNRNDVLRECIEVIAQLGEPHFDEAARVFQQCFIASAESWPPAVQQTVGLMFVEVGFRPSWLASVVEVNDSNLKSGESIDEYLDGLKTQAEARLALDDKVNAAAMARRVVSDAFSVGSRKDVQLLGFVGLLSRAASSNDIDLIEAYQSNLPAFVAMASATEDSGSDALTGLIQLAAAKKPEIALSTFVNVLHSDRVSYAHAADSLIVGVAEALDQVRREEKSTYLRLIRKLSVVIEELLLPSADAPSEEIRKALGKLLRDEAVADIRASLAERAAVVCLPSVRQEWLDVLSGSERALAPFCRRTSPERSSGFGELVLHAEKISEHDACHRINSLEDVLRLRSEETADSHFSWSGHLDHVAFETADIEPLAEALGSAYDASRVLLKLSSRAADAGDKALATRLSERAVGASRLDSWGGMMGRDRRKAFSSLLAVTDADAKGSVRNRALRDLARSVTLETWSPLLMLMDLDDVCDVIAEPSELASIWDQSSAYLRAMTVSVETTVPNPCGDVGTDWRTNGVIPGNTTTDRPIAAALEDLLDGFVLMFIDDPTWVMRDGAEGCVARLARDDATFRENLLRLLERTATNPLFTRLRDENERTNEPDASGFLERLVVSTAAAAQLAGDTDRQTLIGGLAKCDTSIAAALAREFDGSTQCSMSARDLSPIYSVEFPPESFREMPANGLPIGDPTPEETLFGFERILKGAAQAAALDPDTVLYRAQRFGLDAMEDRETIETNIKKLGFRETYYLGPQIGAARQASIRVIAELHRAGRIPGDFSSALVDPDLVNRKLIRRPGWIPPGESGHGVRGDAWVERTEARLVEVCDSIAAFEAQEGEVVVSASARSRLLHWGSWEETFNLRTWVAESENLTDVSGEAGRGKLRRRGIDLRYAEVLRPVERTLSSGEPLSVSNDGALFGTMRQYWNAFNPAVAALCGWKPGEKNRGTWLDDEGALMVRQSFWADGYEGRTPPSFDDIIATGMFVTATADGVVQLREKLGGLDRHASMDRVIESSEHPYLADAAEITIDVPG